MSFAAEFYREFYVSRATQRFVNKIWWLNNLNSQDSTQTNFILPNGCHNLAIIEGCGAQVNTQVANYYLTSGFYLASQMTAKVAVELSPNTRITLIQLHPWTLSTILNLNLNDTADRIERVDQQFLGKEISLGAEKQIDIDKLVSEVDQLFIERSNYCQTSLIESICKEVLVKKGICKVVDIVSKHESSARTIQLIFKASTGLTLKQYINIIKLRAAVDTISCNADKKTSITHIALDHHYFDQTHFIKSFKKIVKVTPLKFDKQSFILSKIRA